MGSPPPVSKYTCASIHSARPAWDIAGVEARASVLAAAHTQVTTMNAAVTTSSGSSRPSARLNSTKLTPSCTGAANKQCVPVRRVHCSLSQASRTGTAASSRFGDCAPHKCVDTHIRAAAPCGLSPQPESMLGVSLAVSASAGPPTPSV